VTCWLGERILQGSELDGKPLWCPMFRINAAPYEMMQHTVEFAQSSQILLLQRIIFLSAGAIIIKRKMQYDDAA
jgi:hypothetical protein